jgi:colanic acid biosynthesis glycosyl transferase WcaI
MRIIFITQWFDPEPGAIRGLPLARWLVQQGHQVKVITGFPNYPGGKVYPGYKIRLSQWEEIDGVKILRVPLYPSHDASSLKRILNYLSFMLASATIGVGLIGSADVVYVYHPPPTVGLAALVLKFLRGIPYVYHIADMWPESVLESGMIADGWKRRTFEAMINRYCRLLYRGASSVTVLSPGFKRLLVERGVDPQKVEVIYNWTEEEVFKPLEAEQDFASKLGLAGKFNVVYAGNLGALQGLENVLAAAERLASSYPQLQFVFAGTGQKEQQLRQLAAKLKLTNVLFLGRREYWEMPRVNACAQVLLVHLRNLPFFEATIPSKTQVALASAKPVLMAVGGDAAEVITEAKAGVVCVPEDVDALVKAVLELYSMQQQELEQLGRNGREYYMQNMSLECGGRRMLEVFSKACNQSPAASGSTVEIKSGKTQSGKTNVELSL